MIKSDIELFETYIEYHNCRVGNAMLNELMFCLGAKCHKCINSDDCSEKGRVPKITKNELEIFKNKYPEKFI